MIALFLIILFGLGTAYFSTQNIGQIPVTIGGYTFQSIPIYIVVIVSMLFGVFTSWLISIVDSLSSSMTIHGKDHEIKKAEREIAELHEKNRELELANAQMNAKVNWKEVEEKQTEKDESFKPSIFQSFRHRFG